jgi:DNA-binding transcriptional ArsR family regulator
MRIRAMTGSEISRNLNISRQAVSQSLKRAVTKMYVGLQEKGITESPVETVMVMREWLEIKDEDDIIQFYELFPKQIREEIKEDAKAFGHIRE